MSATSIPLWTLIPFILMLLSIAVFPLVKKTEHFWESNRNKLIVSIILSIPVIAIFAANGMTHNIIHQVVYDYVPFIALLLSLFIVTGGIFINIDFEAKPVNNTVMLAIGMMLASFMGTTGAAMLLIRPLLNINKQRKHTVHTVLFFIAIVANCGGLLTPLGDPPLFMLYLRGASFGWFFGLFAEWLVAGLLLLLIYFIYDTIMYKKENKLSLRRDAAEREPLKIDGKINFVLLLGVIASVAFINKNYFVVSDDPAKNDNMLKLIQSGALIIIGLLSMLLTNKKTRFEDNKFSWTPILEVAALFIGIFITMVPALMYLQNNAPNMGLEKDYQFYYMTGALSSFLDNTPTALAFHSVALGLDYTGFAGTMVAGVPEFLLRAISTAAVFFGAMTYIGNGPNFMVKAIAEQSGIKMPDFFKYIYKFAIIFVLPVYVIVQLIFF
ncbi:MAG: sodium:proton antiporter [Bacteroidales bacterium]|nr:sodium:proton antiporter [Bacteroidales bacterium]